MRVRALKGTNLKSYTLLIPVSSDISDLSQEIQDAIKKFGELKVEKQLDLDSNNPLHAETVQKIEEQGAYLWKTTVEFTEIC